MNKTFLIFTSEKMSEGKTEIKRQEYKHAGVANILKQKSPYLGAPIESLISEFAQSGCFEATDNGHGCSRSFLYTKGDKKLDCKNFCIQDRTRAWLRPFFIQLPFSADLKVRHEGKGVVNLDTIENMRINEMKIIFYNHIGDIYFSFYRQAGPEIASDKWTMFTREKIFSKKPENLYKMSTIEALIFASLVVHNKRDQVASLEVTINFYWDYEKPVCDFLKCKISHIVQFKDNLGADFSWLGNPEKWNIDFNHAWVMVREVLKQLIMSSFRFIKSLLF